MNVNNIFLLLPVCLGLAATSHASPAFALTPSPDIFGAPGDLIGWGFSITNDANYIEITSAQFCLLPVGFPSSCTPSTLGTFIDFISGFNDIIVGPPAGTLPDVAAQNYDPVAFTGVGSFSIDNSAPLFATDFGAIVLTYDEYDKDPNDPTATQIGFDNILSANASVSVQNPVGDVPEPATWWLTGPVLIWWRLSRRRPASPYF